jgi:hypothetical protein
MLRDDTSAQVLQTGQATILGGRERAICSSRWASDQIILSCASADLTDCTASTACSSSAVSSAMASANSASVSTSGCLKMLGLIQQDGRPVATRPRFAAACAAAGRIG